MISNTFSSIKKFFTKKNIKSYFEISLSPNTKKNQQLSEIDLNHPFTTNDDDDDEERKNIKPGTSEGQRNDDNDNDEGNKSIFMKSEKYWRERAINRKKNIISFYEMKSRNKSVIKLRKQLKDELISMDKNKEKSLGVKVKYELINGDEFPGNGIELVIENGEKVMVEDLSGLLYVSDIVITSYPIWMNSCQRYGFKVFINSSLEGMCDYEVEKIDGQFEKYQKMPYLYEYDLMIMPSKNDRWWLVTPEGGVIKCMSIKEIFEFIEKRKRVTWFIWKEWGSSTNSIKVDVREESRGEDQESGEGKVYAEILREKYKEEALKIVRFAIDYNLLTSLPGNLSYRMEDDYFLVSPSGVNKTWLNSDTFVAAKYFEDGEKNEKRIESWDDNFNSPSIDSGAQAVMYFHLKHIQAFLHFHYSRYIICFPISKTLFNYPCGCEEEAIEILDCLTNLPSKFRKKSFCIDMIKHGYLLGLTKDYYPKMFLIWEEIINKVKKRMEIETKDKVYPIFINSTISGATVVKNSEKENVFVYIKNGLGKKYRNMIIKEVKHRKLKAKCSLLT